MNSPLISSNELGTESDAGPGTLSAEHDQILGGSAKDLLVADVYTYANAERRIDERQGQIA